MSAGIGSRVASTWNWYAKLVSEKLFGAAQTDESRGKEEPLVAQSRCDGWQEKIPWPPKGLTPKQVEEEAARRLYEIHRLSDTKPSLMDVKKLLPDRDPLRTKRVRSRVVQRLLVTKENEKKKIMLFYDEIPEVVMRKHDELDHCFKDLEKFLRKVHQEIRKQYTGITFHHVKLTALKRCAHCARKPADGQGAPKTKKVHEVSIPEGRLLSLQSGRKFSKRVQSSKTSLKSPS